jgi:hypothetical protein
MKTKYIIIILLVLFILVNIFKYKDTFTNTSSFATSAGFVQDLQSSNNKNKNNKIFKNIFNITTEEKIVEADILEQKLPKLKFYSYEKCPKLYKLFKGLSAKVVSDINDEQIENVDGLRFRNKIRSAFYNIDRTIKIEHPLIDIERKLMPVTIKGNIQTKLNIDSINNITINIISYQDYIENTYSEVDDYQELINNCNLIFLYLENRIPKKMSEYFIRLKDILEEEKEKVKKLKDIDPKALFLKDLKDRSNLPSEEDTRRTISYNNYIEAYVTAQTFLTLTRQARDEAETAEVAEVEAEGTTAEETEVVIEKLKFNEQEKEYLIKIQNRIIDYEDYNYSKLVNDIITLESLDQKKNKYFCAMLLLYVYNNINVPITSIYVKEKINSEINKTITLLEDYKIDNLNLEYKIEDKIVIEIDSIKEELSKLKTTVVSDDKLILDNPNFIFELGGKKINYFTDNHIEQTHKQVSFNVKTDFTEDDVVNFVEYCFNLCCFGAINIDLLSFTENHYRVLPCFNPIHKSNTHYYILPERIRKVAMEEGKEYTRAKCTGCASNIIIFFNKLPDKFKYYEAIKGEPDKENNEFINDILQQ